MKLHILIPLVSLAAFLSGCTNTSHKSKVPNLAAIEAMPDSCLPASQLFANAYTAAGIPADVVKLQIPIDETRPNGPKTGHAICVYVEGGNVWAYDPQFGGSSCLNLGVATVFGANPRPTKGRYTKIVLPVDTIHRRARPRDFHGVHWGNGLNTDLRGGLW